MKKVRICVLVSAILLFVSNARTQTLEFEVATLKPTSREGYQGPTYSGGSCHGVDKQYAAGGIAPPPVGRCVFKLVTLNQLIATAYKVAVAGGPSWVGSDRFEVEAKAENTATVTEEQLIAMLQTLVTQRFKLQSHREQRDIPAFSLFVARNGPKLLKEVSSDDRPRVQFGPGAKVTATNVTMTYFASSIQGMARGPVTDKTELKGKYDFSFEWPTGEPDSFLSEMQAQLGLRVESTKTPMEFLVIDRAEKPVQ